MPQVIGSEDLSPADVSAILARISAEVAKIAGADEVEVAEGGIGHLMILDHLPRWKMTGRRVARCTPLYSLLDIG